MLCLLVSLPPDTLLDDFIRSVDFARRRKLNDVLRLGGGDSVSVTAGGEIMASVNWNPRKAKFSSTGFGVELTIMAGSESEAKVCVTDRLLA